MKTMKKLLALLLALSMVFALATTALAADGDEPTEPTEGTITVTKVHYGETYKLYKMLDLSWDGADAYAYSVNPAWAAFFAAPVKNEAGEVTTAAGPGYALVTWDTTGKFVTDLEIEAETFAKTAIEWAEDNKIAPVKNVPVGAAPSDWDGESFADDIVWDGLELGYYVLSTTSGTLCTLDTNAPYATVEDKHDLPKVEKTVAEAQKYAKTNTSGIGDVVEYNTDIYAKKGAKAYVLRDKMTTGLTFKELVSVKVGNGDLREWEADVADDAWDYKFTLLNAKNPDDDPESEVYNFKIEFNQKYLDTIQADTTISVKYTATVNEDAKICYPVDPLDKTNWNKTDLVYGDGTTTLPDWTKTYVYELDVFKFGMVNGKKTPLEGAEFILYKDVTNGTETLRHYLIAAAKDGQVWEVTGWTAGVATTDKTYTGATVFTTDATGFIYIEGLDEGTYMLRETVAPQGYNLPDHDFEAKIAADGSFGTALDDEFATEEVPNAVQIQNESGNKLPSTGGIGTTLFYVIGSIMMVGAAVLLVAKKRTSI